MLQFSESIEGEPYLNLKDRSFYILAFDFLSFGWEFLHFEDTEKDSFPPSKKIRRDLRIWESTEKENDLPSFVLPFRKSSESDRMKSSFLFLFLSLFFLFLSTHLIRILHGDAIFAFSGAPLSLMIYLSRLVHESGIRPAIQDDLPIRKTYVIEALLIFSLEWSESILPDAVVYSLDEVLFCLLLSLSESDVALLDIYEVRKRCHDLISVFSEFYLRQVDRIFPVEYRKKLSSESYLLKLLGLDYFRSRNSCRLPGCLSFVYHKIEKSEIIKYYLLTRTSIFESFGFTRSMICVSYCLIVVSYELTRPYDVSSFDLRSL